jgi:hypothetical protein
MGAKMENTIDFLKPRLVGKRFEHHSIPLDVLRDLSFLEEMIRETAKWLFFEDNKGRERIPKGFMDGVSIRLTDIDEGSAIPKFVLIVSVVSGSLLPASNQMYFERARDSIVNAIDSAENDMKIVDHLPDYLLGYFDKIGRSLSDDEQIEFRPENRERPARLNKKTRKALILSSSKVTEYTEEISLLGMICEMDKAKGTCTLESIDGQKINAVTDAFHKDIIESAFSEYEYKKRVRLKGIGKFNRDNKLVRIDSIENIDLIDDLDIAARVEELKLLKDGWLDGKGKALGSNSLKWLSDSFDQLYDQKLPLPRLFPTPEGNIHAEWVFNEWEISLEIDLTTKISEYQAVNTASLKEINDTYDLNDSNSWSKLCLSLRNIQGVNT